MGRQKKPTKIGKQVEELTKRILPLVHAEPACAFATGITRKLLKEGRAADQYWSFENNVGAALRLLERNGMLTSTKSSKHPEGRTGTVRLYSITKLGIKALNQLHQTA